MAAVRVFVDDAVLGRFPPVCAKTGMPSDGRLAVTTTVGGSGRVSAPWLILLVLLGPIGWVALAVLAVALPDRTERLTVEVPWTTAADERLRSARTRRTLMYGIVAAGIVGLVAAVALPVGPVGGSGAQLAVRLVLGALAVALVGGFLAALAAERAVARWTIGVELDGSRRWVTLDGVHPGFVAAVQPRPQAADRHPG
jgi:hypothetical protein